MNPLVTKEIRLILPTYLVALLLATSPLWPAESSSFSIAWLALGLGVTLLALVPIGREFNLRTFSFLMSQPVQRARIWWTKLAVLGIAMATVFCLWTLCSGILLPTSRWVKTPDTWSGWTGGQEFLAIMALATVVIFTGALWTTLLVRQIMAAFWLTAFFPAALLLLTYRAGDGPLKIFGVLGLYSAAGFVFAWWQFWRAQDAGWSGGVISLGSWRSPGRVVSAANHVHRRRPLWALFWKELRLQELTLAGMAGLFALHLVVVVVRKHWHHGDQAQLAWGMMDVVLNCFGLLWLAVPFIAGSASVAEERRLGTLEPQSCLPVSPRWQLAIKLLVVLLLGGLLSSLLLLTVEGIGSAIGAGTGIAPQKLSSDPDGFTTVLSIFAAVSAVAFYASTLARNIIQAMAATVVAALGAWLVVTLTLSPLRLYDIQIWGLYLPERIVWPAMILTGAWLAHRNFTRFSDGWRFWLRNVLGLVSALGLSMAAAGAGYNRVWEFFTPAEPPHAPSRMALSKPATFHAWNSPLVGILPDGRLFCDYVFFASRLVPNTSAAQAGQRALAKASQPKWVSFTPVKLSTESNWVSVAASRQDIVAVRADGSLWISDQPAQNVKNWHSGRPLTEASGWVRFGADTNWQDVVRNEFPSPMDAFMLLLKTDGSLWIWKYANPQPNRSGNGLRDTLPRRLGAESDWAKIMPTTFGTCLRKTNGQVWVLTRSNKPPLARQTALEDNIMIERGEALDGFEWRSLTQGYSVRAGVRSDGSLWVLQRGFEMAPTQIGSDTDWAAVAGGNNMLAILKQDGSLWKMRFRPWLPGQLPARWGTHSDWVGIGDMEGHVVSLAADGSLWRWLDPTDYGWQFLRTSRKPQLIDNMFATEK